MLIFSAAERRNSCSAAFILLLSSLSHCSGRAEMQICCRLTQEIIDRWSIKLGGKTSFPEGAVEVPKAVWMLLEMSTSASRTEADQ